MKVWADMSRYERTEAIRELAGQLMSGARIAKELRAPSRNAVLGLAAKRGITLKGRRTRAEASTDGRAGRLAGAETAMRDGKLRRPPRLSKNTDAFGAALTASAASGKTPSQHNPQAWTLLPGQPGVNVVDRAANQCAWPCYGDDVKELADRICCGAPVDPERDLALAPYCSHHARLGSGGLPS